MTSIHQQEIWKPILGWEGYYEISSVGRWRSVDRTIEIHRKSSKFKRQIKGKIMKPRKRRSGHLDLILQKSNQKPFRASIHRIMLEVFVGPKPDGMEACHNNGIPWDNRLDNLRWDTHKENMQDKEKHGTSNRGEKHGLSKLTETDVLQIIDMLDSGISHSKIAAVFNVKHQAITKINRGQRWGWLTGRAA